MKKAPVFAITQALSSEFYFRTWYNYYSREIGAENIFIITDKNGKPKFEGITLGGIIAYPSSIFDDASRAELIGSVVKGLLGYYEAAIVTDTDEFLVPDPRKYSGITNYLENRTDLYSTSIGIDIIQHVDEAELDFKYPIIGTQRRFGYLTSSLCKTSLTRIPLQWGVGFHYCSTYPQFNDTFLIHMKRADKNLQYKWHEFMSLFEFSAEQTRNYYRAEQVRIDNFHDMVMKWRLIHGWAGAADEQFIASFLKEVRLDRTNTYRGKHFASEKLFTIPSEFFGKL